MLSVCQCVEKQILSTVVFHEGEGVIAMSKSYSESSHGARRVIFPSTSQSTNRHCATHMILDLRIAVKA